jgi:hypothetical protein
MARAGTRLCCLIYHDVGGCLRWGDEFRQRAGAYDRERGAPEYRDHGSNRLWNDDTRGGKHVYRGDYELR